MDNQNYGEILSADKAKAQLHATVVSLMMGETKLSREECERRIKESAAQSRKRKIDSYTSHRRALTDLKYFIEASMNFDMKDMTPGEKLKFSQDHPGAHFVIGDFQITCLNPQKYGLEP